MQTTLTILTPELTPDDILSRARTGDGVGLGWIYDRHAGELYRTAYRLLGSAADAEDLVHDLFVGLPEALRRYDERGQLGAWLKRIVVRLALMHARSERRRRVDSLDDVGELEATGRADTRIDVSEANRVVDALPAEQRIVFLLRQVEGYSHAEIATLLQISPGASRVRLARALASLRRSLK